LDLKILKSIIFIVPIGLVTIPAQSQVLERNQTSSGSNSSFTYSITSRYGVTTAAEGTPNLRVSAKGTLNLKEDSVITNKAGNVGGDTSAVIQTTPNGTSVYLQGIEANNNYIIDEGTSFEASVETTDPDGNPSKGTASAVASHSLTLSIVNGNSTFVNTLRENFEGAQ